MYTIHVDLQRKRIDILFRGHIDMNEIQAYTKDALEILAQFEKKQVLALVNIERLDPLPQECLDICISGLLEASCYFRKIAIIYRKVVTRMQYDRIFCAVNCRTKYKLVYSVFDTRTAALDYLYQ